MKIVYKIKNYIQNGRKQFFHMQKIQRQNFEMSYFHLLVLKAFNTVGFRRMETKGTKLLKNTTEH